MTYALLGKIFVSLVIFLIIWILATVIASKLGGHEHDRMNNGAVTLFFIGPTLGLIVTIIAWIWVLPPYQ